MKRRDILQSTLAAFAVLILILDTRTVIAGAQEGITLCLRTVIPSLFPFIVLTGILGNAIIGKQWKLFAPIRKLCGIPKGSESILVLGFISGYPVGAQLVAGAYRDGNINKQDARRMLSFCSNAGPAFIFGIFGPMFTSKLVPWVLWCTHIISALMIATIIPNKSNVQCRMTTQGDVSLADSLEKAIKIMATVCGWVVIFRIFLSFLNRWIFWLLPIELQAIISGVLELANGCVHLAGISKNGAKFLIAGTLLSFGGLCVFTQTMSVTRGLGCGLYFPGKVMQTVFSFALNSIAQYFLFPDLERCNIPIAVTALCLVAPVCITVIAKRKKVVAFA